MKWQDTMARLAAVFGLLAGCVMPHVRGPDGLRETTGLTAPAGCHRFDCADEGSGLCDKAIVALFSRAEQSVDVFSFGPSALGMRPSWPEALEQLPRRGVKSRAVFLVPGPEVGELIQQGVDVRGAQTTSAPAIMAVVDGQIVMRTRGSLLYVAKGCQDEIAAAQTEFTTEWDRAQVPRERPCIPDRRECSDKCERGNLPSCTTLGLLEQNARDFEAAARADQKACDGGEPSGCTNLGILHMLGQGFPRDEEGGAALFKKACGAGDASGCVFLGYSFVCGKGVGKNMSEARRVFQEACRAGGTAANRDGCSAARRIDDGSAEDKYCKAKKR